MEKAVYHQSSFLGGEWSKIAQGRSDLEAYKTAMNVCLNGLPVRQGAWERRSGTQYLGPAKGRAYTKLLPFVTEGSYSVVIALSELNIRFLVDTSWLTTNDDRVVTASTSTAGALSLTLDDDHGWSAGDTVRIEAVTGAAAEAGLYINRLMQITAAPTTSTLTVADDQGFDFTFDSGAGALLGCTVKRLKEMDPLYDITALPLVRLVQTREAAVLLSYAVIPMVIDITDVAGVVTFGTAPAAAPLKDGPFLKSQELTSGDKEGAAVSGYSGSITFTPAVSTFGANDVGRLIRLFHEPAAWNSGTTYAYGDCVTYQGEWWMSVAAGTYATSNVGVIPGTLATVSGTSVVLWTSAPEAGRWAWGTITAQGGTTATVTLATPLLAANGTGITEWRLGVFKAGQYPTCGAYHNGRLFLAGAVSNRLDASKSDDPWVFSTTDEFGNVTDDSGIGMELNFSGQQKIAWLMSDPKGLIVGTEGGEVLISSEGGITPYDREATQMTNFKCASIEPCRVGLSTIFAQYYRRDIIEYTPNTYGTRFIGTPLNPMSGHLTASLIWDLVYQKTPVPVVWVRSADGHLTGITYERVGDAVSFGSHRHELDDNGRFVASMCVASTTSWRGEMLYLCTYAPNEGYDNFSDYTNGSDFAIEVMRPVQLEL